MSSDEILIVLYPTWITFRPQAFHTGHKPIVLTTEYSAGNYFSYLKGRVSFQTFILKGHIRKLFGHLLTYIFTRINAATLMAFILKLDVQGIVLTMILLFVVFN